MIESSLIRVIILEYTDDDDDDDDDDGQIMSSLPIKYNAFQLWITKALCGFYNALPIFSNTHVMLTVPKNSY